MGGRGVRERGGEGEGKKEDRRRGGGGKRGRGREEGEERTKSNVSCQNLCSQAINWPQ